MTASKTLRVGTRGSLLAVSQTQLILDELKAKNPHISFEIVTIKTSGDEGKDILGAFVKEVEMELRAKNIDLAVHSYKDMPTTLPEGVFVACTPVRGEHRDCLIAPGGKKLKDLPQGAKIGTGSLRRSYQLKAIRPDLEIVPIRGNIVTRMSKAESGELDAVVLAAAGLERVSMRDRISQVFTENEMLPAVAQGVLAIEVREDDSDTIALVKSITDDNTMHAVDAERAFLSGLGGGCRMPIGAYARVQNNVLTIDGLIYTEDGSQVAKGIRSGDPEKAVEIGSRLAEELLKKLGRR
jgi:hydroxymethylbilane synthase